MIGHMEQHIEGNDAYYAQLLLWSSCFHGMLKE